MKGCCYITEEKEAHTHKIAVVLLNKITVVILYCAFFFMASLCLASKTSPWVSSGMEPNTALGMVCCSKRTSVGRVGGGKEGEVRRERHIATGRGGHTQLI